MSEDLIRKYLYTIAKAGVKTHGCTEHFQEVVAEAEKVFVVRDKTGVLSAGRLGINHRDGGAIRESQNKEGRDAERCD